MTNIEQNLRLAEGVAALPAPSEKGVFLRFTAEKPTAYHTFTVGELTGIARFTALPRYEPFWMKAVSGTSAGEIPVETQFLLAETASGDCLLFAPLIDGIFRGALQGKDKNTLEIVAQTGDPATVGTEFTGLYVAFGKDPYQLIAEAAPLVLAQMQSGRLRTEKMLPDFMDSFGWCTWDSFYKEVSEAGVRTGLESFRAGGVEPKLLILDDGWQSVKQFPDEGWRLTAFAANEKFGGDLSSTVQMAKGEFGIETFIVWHAFHGYWGGVDAETLPGYGVRSILREYSPEIMADSPGVIQWFGRGAGVVAPEHIYRFYQDYHKQLRKQGVDGVKVDNQAAVEGLSRGIGGRTYVMENYRAALEGSVQTQFNGNLINCMSCANEMLYGALNSNLTRTSTDFWPKRPESHGEHLYVNAQVSAWFGEFIHPDWDMFQTAHPMGAYHAAGRAVGGCPVYVSDTPDAHDFDLLQKLVLPDGTILRCANPGRPTRDCLFHDPTREAVLLKIFNLNPCGGVLGAFNARYGGEGTPSEPIASSVRPSDIEGLHGEEFVVFAHHADELRTLAYNESWEITLPELTAELFTVVPLIGGVAPIGLSDKFNSGGAVLSAAFDYYAPERYQMTVRGGGTLLVWCETRPVIVEIANAPAEFHYDAATNRLEIPLLEVGNHAILLRF